MRIRSTRPEFWRSHRIASVDWEARLVLKGLESYVDDNGVGKDDMELIVGDVFSRDLVREPARTLMRVHAAINTLSEAGLIHRYADEGTDLLYVAFWESVQHIPRPSKGRFRRPDGSFEYGESKIGAPPLQLHEGSCNPTAGAGEQGSRGAGEQGSRSTSTDVDVTPATAVAVRDRFNEFWDAYGKKIGKGAAEKAWVKATKRLDPDRIIAAAVAHADWHRRNRTEDRFVPHASTWLNEQRWTDERPPPGQNGSRAQNETDAMFDAAMQRAVDRERSTG